MLPGKYWQRKDQLPKREELSSGFLLGHCMKEGEGRRKSLGFSVGSV